MPRKTFDEKLSISKKSCDTFFKVSTHFLAVKNNLGSAASPGEIDWGYYEEVRAKSP